MRSLSPALSEHLASGATTLCWCWRLTRRDGVRLGFTDHDRDIVFDGTTFEAAAGFTASEMREAVGLGVDNMEVESALTSDGLSEDDLAAGVFDDAQVEIFRVNWSAAGQHVLIRTGSLGEIRRSGASFTAEVRGLAHYLQQPGGRLYQYGCDADLGDGRCKVDLDAPAYKGSGTVLSPLSSYRFTASGLGDFAGGWFTGGLLTFTSGANAGRSAEIKQHAAGDTHASLELWQAPGHALGPGDTFDVTAGCDKQFSTCTAKFANRANFRGFPHMPGNDFLTATARSGAGGSTGRQFR